MSLPSVPAPVVRGVQAAQDDLHARLHTAFGRYRQIEAERDMLVKLIACLQDMIASHRPQDGDDAVSEVGEGDEPLIVIASMS